MGRALSGRRNVTEVADTAGGWREAGGSGCGITTSRGWKWYPLPAPPSTPSGHIPTQSTLPSGCSGWGMFWVVEVVNTPPRGRGRSFVSAEKTHGYMLNAVVFQSWIISLKIFYFKRDSRGRQTLWIALHGRFVTLDSQDTCLILKSTSSCNS